MYVFFRGPKVLVKIASGGSRLLARGNFCASSSASLACFHLFTISTKNQGLLVVNKMTFFITVVEKYAGAAIAYVTGSKAGMVVGIIIAIVIVIIIVLCVRQAYKGLKEAKERAMIKLGTLIKREESLELPDAAPDVELSAVQPASSDKKKLVRN